MDFLWRHTWWSYPVAGAGFADELYRGFNFLEAAAWFSFAALVAARFVRFRRSWLEPLYALAFLLFGVTDLLEARALTSWLIWLKLANLIALLWLRAVVIKRCYPDRKLF